MKKLVLFVLALVLYINSDAQYEYHLNGRNDVPVLGRQTGFIAGGFTAMLKNRDDVDADGRLDLEMMNFSYGGGLDHMWWFQNTVGFGFQLLYWKAGGAYSGLDTFTDITLKAKTDLTYFKVPLLFHFKSYNRYYPDRAMRFNACFGPYIALMTSYKDSYSLYNDKNELIGGGYTSGNSIVGYSPSTGNTDVGQYNQPIYKPLELGFVFGFGGEMRITRRTVVSLMIRSDIGISDVENKSKLKFKATGSSVEQDANPWKGLYAKYTAPNAIDMALGWESNRPATKNLSVGAFLSFRKYFRK